MTSLDNPLIDPIERILAGRGAETLSEYQLIGLLKEQGVLDGGATSETLGLFQVHFLVMNALYQLRPVLGRRGLRLSISPLEIRVTAVEDGRGDKAVAVDETDLSDYYLSWSNFKGVTEESVSKLLDRFWQRYLAQDERSRALQILGLPADCLYQDVRRRYRQLVMKVHPDRGGNDADVSQLNEAMAVLKRCSFPDR